MRQPAHRRNIDAGLAPTLEGLRKQIGSHRVVIAHYGEEIPLDSGYRGTRMAHVAGWLRECDVDVVWLAPSFSHGSRSQRPLEWSGLETSVGRVEIIPTRSYGSSRGLDRFRFLRDYCSGSAEAIANMNPAPHVVIVGYPPPGLLASIRRAGSRSTALVADVRDLWPDALIPSDRPVLAKIAQVAGRLLAQEIRLADGAVAMSELMLARVPERRRDMAIPLNIADGVSTGALDEVEGPMQVIFVGSLTSLFDFDSMLKGWDAYISRRPVSQPLPSLKIAGDGPLLSFVEQSSRSMPSVEALGRVAPSDVPSLLFGSDIGVAPTRLGQGTTMSNKVLEYLGSGLVILHSLTEPVSRQIGEHGIRVRPTVEGWAEGFASLERDLFSIRAERRSRRDDSVDRFGREAIEERWLRFLLDIV